MYSININILEVARNAGFKKPVLYTLVLNSTPPVLTAYQQAYPQIFDEVKPYNGDWVITTHSNQTFY